MSVKIECILECENHLGEGPLCAIGVGPRELVDIHELTFQK